MAGRILSAIFIIILLSAFSSHISGGIRDFRTDDVVQNEIVATAAGVTSANITLDNDLYSNDTTNIVSISSNLTETPVATSYTSSTNVLLVSALNANTSRTLIISYYGDTDDTMLHVIGPFMSFLIFGGILFSAFFLIYSGIKRRR